MIIPEGLTITESEDKRQAILDATLRLVVARGLESTPMSLIAREAQVGMGTIYHYFSSKEELVNILYIELKDRMSEVVLEGYSVKGTLRERFFFIWRNLLRYYQRHPLVFKFLDQHSMAPCINQVAKTLEQSCCWDATVQLIADGQKQQVFKPLPTYLLFLIASAPLSNLMRGSLSGAVTLDEATMEAAITACWDAIKL